MFDVNVGAILSAAVFSMVLGWLWYGPLFGQLWLRVNELTALDEEGRAAMQRGARVLYPFQFALTLIQIYILSLFVDLWPGLTGTEVALFLWLGFIVPSAAGLSMWNQKTGGARFTLFSLFAGYQLVQMIVFGFILGNWG